MNKKRIAGLMLLPAAVAVMAFLPHSQAADKSKNSVATPLETSERQLRDVSEVIHHLRHDTSGLLMECQRENDLEGGEIDFVGTDIIPIIPATAEGFGGAQYLPPRPKYINLHMSALGSTLPLLGEEIGEIKAPDQDVAPKIAPFTADMQTLWSDVQKQYATLQGLCAMQNAGSYDNGAIVAAAGAMNKDLENIEKAKRQVYKAYKHDPDKGNGPAVTDAKGADKD